MHTFVVSDCTGSVTFAHLLILPYRFYGFTSFRTILASQLDITDIMN